MTPEMLHQAERAQSPVEALQAESDRYFIERNEARAMLRRALLVIETVCFGPGEPDDVLREGWALLHGETPKRHPVTVAGFEVRPMTRDRLDGSPEERFWRALDRLGRPHDADSPEAAARAAGARITPQEEAAR